MGRISRKITAARRRMTRRKMVLAFLKHTKREIKTMKDLHEAVEAFRVHCVAGSMINSKSVAVAIAASTLLLAVPTLIKEAEKEKAKQEKRLK